jgi:pimeloyl-ACP methyl ester carboxylesterase
MSLHQNPEQWLYQTQKVKLKKGIMNSHVNQIAKGPIEYTLLGSGPVILVCHGTSSNCFSTEISSLLVEAGFSVLTPSRPGYGRTPLEVGPSTAEAAVALISLLEKLQIQQCSVVAISGGGPTGVALAALFPQQVSRLVLAAAITHPENRPNEPSYKNQTTFYGPMHSIKWGMLGMMSRLSPRGMARQTLAIFSTHDPDDGLSKLSPGDIEGICRFYQGRSARKGALNDAAHTVGADLLKTIRQPTLVIHSREDNCVPFAHAEWSLKYIPQAELCEAGITGHFFWVGPDKERISQRISSFLNRVSR